MDSDVVLNIHKFPVYMCLLEGAPKYTWDLLEQTNYRGLADLELKDEVYPKGGYPIEDRSQLIRLAQSHDIRYAVYYYKPSGEIITLIKYNDLTKVKEFQLWE